MTTNKIFIENVRKIAKTDEILKKLPTNNLDVDKASIGKKRGVGLADDSVFNPCQLLYSSTDGVYTFAGLVAGTEGPRIQDGDYNHCAQVNTITGMRETGVSPTLKMILKPDGVFIPLPTDYMYTSLDIIYLYLSNPELFDPVNKWAFYSPDDVVNFLISIYPAFSGIPYESHELDSEPFFLTEEQISTFNYEITYPVYKYIVLFSSSSSVYSALGGFIFALPFDYDFSIDSQGIMQPPPLIDSPYSPTYGGSGATPPIGVPDDELTVYANTYGYPFYVWFNSMTVAYGLDPTGIIQNAFQLAIDVGATNLWKPNPEETTAPVKYTNGVSIVTFEFGAGYTRTGMVRPAKDGGFMLGETTAGEYINNVYVYRRDRTLTTVVPAAQASAYLA